MSGDTTLEEVILSILTHKGVMRHIDLVLYCLDSDMKLIQGEILRKISEMSMDSKIKRLEYVLPNSNERRAIYFPLNTTIY